MKSASLPSPDERRRLLGIPVSRRTFNTAAAIAVAGIPVTAWIVNKEFKRAQKLGEVEKMFREFPTQLDGAARIEFGETPGATQTVVFYLYDHRLIAVEDAGKTLPREVTDSNHRSSRDMMKVIKHLQRDFPQYKSDTMFWESMSPNDDRTQQFIENERAITNEIRLTDARFGLAKKGSDEALALQKHLDELQSHPNHVRFEKIFDAVGPMILSGNLKIRGFETPEANARAGVAWKEIFLRNNPSPQILKEYELAQRDREMEFLEVATDSGREFVHLMLGRDHLATLPETIDLWNAKHPESRKSIIIIVPNEKPVGYTGE